MKTVTVSSKYQVVIPKSVRKALGIRAGQKIQVVVYEGRFKLLPLTPFKELRGFAKGIVTSLDRDEDRR